MTNINNMIPKLMHLMRFHGQLTIEQIRNYTGFGKASIRGAVTTMVKSGLLKRDAKLYGLTKDSKYWLGWQDRQF